MRMGSDSMDCLDIRLFAGNDCWMTISKTIRAAIRFSGLTNKQLADKAGVDPASLWRFVHSDPTKPTNITLDTIERLAMALGLELKKKI
jgi:transcriptional regulator with XRE-family HTH domain